MYVLTLEINQLCNFNCSYCYLNEKNGKVMDLEVAKKSINFAFEQVKTHHDKTLWIDFIGGEILLSFVEVHKMVQYIEQKKEDSIIIYSLTTNGILLNEENIDFLIKYRFKIKLSLDGRKQINDQNRYLLNGDGSYNKIVEKIQLLNLYYEKTGNYVQVTNVITKNNYTFYYDSFKHLVLDLGFKIIDTAIDFTVNWTEKEILVIEQEIEKSFIWYINQCKQGHIFYWSFLDELKGSVTKKKCFYSCGAGIISLYVDVVGNYYPCCGNVNEFLRLGNYQMGLFKHKINYLRNLESTVSNKCINCDIYEFCSAKGCISIDRIQDNILEPDFFSCHMQKFKYNFYFKYKEVIKELYGGN